MAVDRYWRTLGLTLFCVGGFFPANAQESGEGLPADLKQRAEAANQVFDHGNRREGLQTLIQIVVETERALGKNHPAVASIHNAISVMFQSERMYERALLHADRSIECAAGFGDPKHVRLLQAKTSRAVCLMSLGRVEEAEKIYRELVLSFQEIGNAEGHGQALVGLGTALSEMGRYGEAERSLLAALELQKTRGQEQRNSKTLSTLGHLYTDLGDYERALFYQIQAIAAGRKEWGDGHAFLVDKLTGAARSMRRLKRYDEAQTLLSEARRIAEASSGPGSPQLALLSGFEANLATDIGDFEKAMGLESALLKTQEERFGRAFSGREVPLNNLGYLAALKGDFVRADALLSEALTLTEQSYGKDNVAATNCIMNRSILAALRGDPAQAVAFLNDGNSRYEAVMESVSGLGVDSQKLAFLQQLSGKTHYAITLHQKMFPQDDGARRAALMTILSRKGRAADLTRRVSASGAGDPNQSRRTQLLGEIASLALGKTQDRPGVAKQKAWSLQQELERLDRETRPGAAPDVSKVSLPAGRHRSPHGKPGRDDDRDGTDGKYL